MSGMSIWIKENVVKELPVVGKAVDPKNKGIKRRAASAAKCATSYTGAMVAMYMIYMSHANKDYVPDSTQAAKDLATMTTAMAAGMTGGKIFFNAVAKFGTLAYDCYVGKPIKIADDLEMQSLVRESPALPAP